MAVALALALGGPSGREAEARSRPPASLPLPPSRPPEEPERPPTPVEAAPHREPPAEAPLPATAGLPATLALPPLRPADRPATPESEIPGNDVQACQARLRALGVRFEPLPAIREGVCGAPSPVRVSSLAGGLELVPAATVTCPVAEALARWVQEDVRPQASRLLDRAPRRLRIGGSYECRGRNRVAGAKLSEHAFANAVDIMGVEFDRGPAFIVTFQKPGSPEERFQAAIREQACARFRTVLGPGSDASHHDHIHLDLRARRGGGYCQ